MMKPSLGWKSLFFVGLMEIFLVRSASFLWAEEPAARAQVSASAPLYSKFSEIEKRLDRLEQKQQELLALGEKILAELGRVRVQIRRT